MHSFTFLPRLLGCVNLLLRKLFKELLPACPQCVELYFQAGQGDAWARLPTGHLQVTFAWDGTVWSLGIPVVLLQPASQQCPSASTDVCSCVDPPFHSSFSWSVPVFVPRVLPPLVLSFSNSQSCIAPYSPASLFPVLKLILSFLPSSAQWSAYSSCFSQPQNSFSLSATLLSLHLNQLLSLSFVNTRGRRGRKRSLKRR